MFFLAAGKRDHASMGITENTFDGCTGSKAWEAVCIFKFLGTGHPQNVPKSTRS